MGPPNDPGLDVRLFLFFVHYVQRCITRSIHKIFAKPSADFYGGFGDLAAGRSDVNVRVFSIDKNFDDPTLNTLKSFYNITKSPAIIVNNKIKKEDFVSISELIGLIKP